MGDRDGRTMICGANTNAGRRHCIAPGLNDFWPLFALSSATDGLVAGSLKATQAREEARLVSRHAWLAGCKPTLPPLRRLTLMTTLERVGREKSDAQGRER